MSTARSDGKNDDPGRYAYDGLDRVLEQIFGRSFAVVVAHGVVSLSPSDGTSDASS